MRQAHELSEKSDGFVSLAMTNAHFSEISVLPLPSFCSRSDLAGKRGKAGGGEIGGDVRAGLLRSQFPGLRKPINDWPKKGFRLKKEER